jgi:pimeloyl-ACP methyl ester carboxylesterase
MPFVVAGGHRLEYARIAADGGESGTLVLLHEGLGSIAMWRDFPERLAAAMLAMEMSSTITCAARVTTPATARPLPPA